MRDLEAGTITILLFHPDYCVERFELLPFLLAFGSQPQIQSISLLFERKDAHRVDSSPDQQQRFHISSWQTSHFHFKKETRLLWLELPLAAPQQLFLEIYRISALLCENLPSGVFTHSSIDGSPCCLQTACLRGCFTPILCHGKENTPLAKKSWNGGCFLWEGKKKKKNLRRSAPP